MLPIPTAHREPASRTGAGSSVIMWSPSVCTLLLSGERDLSNCADIPLEVERLCLLGCCQIWIDLGSVPFIDAATVGAVLRARQLARASGSDVALVGVGGSPLRLLRLLDLDRELIEAKPSYG